MSEIIWHLSFSDWLISPRLSFKVECNKKSFTYQKKVKRVQCHKTRIARYAKGIARRRGRRKKKEEGVEEEEEREGERNTGTYVKK